MLLRVLRSTGLEALRPHVDTVPGCGLRLRCTPKLVCWLVWASGFAVKILHPGASFKVCQKRNMATAQDGLDSRTRDPICWLNHS